MKCQRFLWDQICSSCRKEPPLENLSAHVSLVVNDRVYSGNGRVESYMMLRGWKLKIWALFYSYFILIYISRLIHLPWDKGHRTRWTPLECDVCHNREDIISASVLSETISNVQGPLRLDNDSYEKIIKCIFLFYGFFTRAEQNSSFFQPLGSMNHAAFCSEFYPNSPGNSTTIPQVFFHLVFGSKIKLESKLG